jgi:hypothetical protein
MDENKELSQIIDQHRWLMNNGLITDTVKNQLFFCGSIVHKNVQALSVDVNPETKTVKYSIYVNASLIDQIEKYKELSVSKTLWGMWKFKRIIKKEGNLDFQKVLNKFVLDFCGSKWRTKVDVLDFATYIDEVQEGESEGSGYDFNKLSDK